MTFKYTAQLDIEAHVPEDPSLQGHFKHSISFEILCPVAGCDSIKKNGKDLRHSLRPQWFFCKIHRISFYAYTSWLMVRLTEIVIQRILLSLFSGKNTAVQLAKQYHISPSVISNLIHHCQEYVEYILCKIKETQQALKKDTDFAETRSANIIWLDEIFFKVGGSSLPLIIAINGDYQVVGWKLGKTRKAEDIAEVLTEVSRNQPDWYVLIADGARSYPKALVSMKKDCYLIQHVHSKPWHVTQIHKFEVLPDKSITQSIIELQYNAFMSADLQVGYALEKTHLAKDTNDPNDARKPRKVGRPKGSKNKKKKKQRKIDLNDDVEEKKKKRRGPKTPKSVGKAFKLDNHDAWLQVKWYDEQIVINHEKKSYVDIPSLSTIQELILVSFAIFQGGAMVSNLIESMNAVVRNSVSDRGIKTESHLRQHVNGVMQLNSPVTGIIAPQSNVPIAKRTGFVNLGQFIKPEIDCIEVLVSVGGV